MKRVAVLGMAIFSFGFATLLTPQGGKIFIHTDPNTNTEVQVNIREITLPPKYENRIVRTDERIVKYEARYENVYRDSYYTRWLQPIMRYVDKVSKDVIVKPDRPNCLWWEGEWCVVYYHKYSFEGRLYTSYVSHYFYASTAYTGFFTNNFQIKYSPTIRVSLGKRAPAPWKYILGGLRIRNELGYVLVSSTNKFSELSDYFKKYYAEQDIIREGWAVEYRDDEDFGFCGFRRGYIASMNRLWRSCDPSSIAFLGGINSVNLTFNTPVPIKRIWVYGWTDDGWHLWINGKDYGQNWGGDEDDDNLLERASAYINVRERSVSSISVRDGGGWDAFPMLKVAIQY